MTRTNTSEVESEDAFRSRGLGWWRNALETSYGKSLWNQILKKDSVSFEGLWRFIMVKLVSAGVCIPLPRRSLAGWMTASLPNGSQTRDRGYCSAIVTTRESRNRKQPVAAARGDWRWTKNVKRCELDFSISSLKGKRRSREASNL